MSRGKYKIGDKINRLTVLDFAESYKVDGKSQQAKYMVKCECGVEYCTFSSTIRDNIFGCRACADKGKIVNYVGKKVGKLTVVAHTGEYYTNPTSGAQVPYVESVCECGNRDIRVATNLRNDKASCGCEVKKHLQSVQDSRKNDAPGWYRKNAYKHSKSAKKYGYFLTDEQFLTLVGGACYYCGAESAKQGCYKGTYRETWSNGIDRVDSKQGYIVENCVTCCKMCNIAKNNHSVEEFFEWAKRLGKNVEKIEKNEKT